MTSRSDHTWTIKGHTAECDGCGALARCYLTAEGGALAAHVDAPLQSCATMRRARNVKVALHHAYAWFYSVPHHRRTFNAERADCVTAAMGRFVPGGAIFETDARELADAIEALARYLGDVEGDVGVHTAQAIRDALDAPEEPAAPAIN